MRDNEKRISARESRGLEAIGVIVTEADWMGMGEAGEGRGGGDETRRDDGGRGVEGGVVNRRFDIWPMIRFHSSLVMNKLCLTCA